MIDVLLGLKAGDSGPYPTRSVSTASSSRQLSGALRAPTPCGVDRRTTRVTYGYPQYLGDAFYV